jgi:phosphate starvation-inducible protein PhoH
MVPEARETDFQHSCHRALAENRAGMGANLTGTGKNYIAAGLHLA